MTIYTLKFATEALLVFVLVDGSSTEVAGLGGTFDVAISKNGAAFEPGAGDKAEIGSGWYSYRITAEETDTVGSLAIKVSGTGTIQQNLLYYVYPTMASRPIGSQTGLIAAHILTEEEAAIVLRCAEDDPNMLELLPLVDAYLFQATGRDWVADEQIRPEAKSAARMLLVQWHENPGGIAAASGGRGFGVPGTPL